MKKSYRNRYSVLLAAALAAGSSMAVRAESSTEELKLEEGQRMASIRVVSITGNELTYYEIAAENEPETETEGVPDEDTEGIPETETEGVPDADTEEVPDTGDVREKEAGRIQEAGTGSTPETEPASETSENAGAGGRGRMGMEAETETVYLPVAVTVHTDTDEERTFSILEAGDELEVLIAEDESGADMIIEIWMTDPEDQENEENN
ncbi:MAG TPA: hypothetical protein IAB97_02130 [Candidatus Choladousia intestinipullorum]|nr:hypothetical protein [Candidatus Choladousia intestinipullorum]